MGKCPTFGSPWGGPEPLPSGLGSLVDATYESRARSAMSRTSPVRAGFSGEMDPIASWRTYHVPNLSRPGWGHQLSAHGWHLDAESRTSPVRAGFSGCPGTHGRRARAGPERLPSGLGSTAGNALILIITRRSSRTSPVRAGFSGEASLAGGYYVVHVPNLSRPGWDHRRLGVRLVEDREQGSRTSPVRAGFYGPVTPRPAPRASASRTSPVRAGFSGRSSRASHFRPRRPEPLPSGLGSTARRFRRRPRCTGASRTSTVRAGFSGRYAARPLHRALPVPNFSRPGWVLRRSGTQWEVTAPNAVPNLSRPGWVLR